MEDITDPEKYQKIFLEIKAEALALYEQDKFKDTSPIFLEAIKNLNKLSFMFTTGSCSSHVENPMPDPLGHTRVSPVRKPLPCIGLKNNLLVAPKDKLLVLLGYVILTLSNESNLSELFIAEFEQLLKEYPYAELTGKGDLCMANRGILTRPVALRFNPWSSLPFSGYTRSDLDIYIVDSETGSSIRATFDDFWKKLSKLAIKFQKLDKK